MPGLLKEIWIGQIMEPKAQPVTWMDRIGQDMSELVEYNTINLADAGVDPDVLINNTTYPVTIAERADNALALPLDYFDTVNTVVRNAENVQLSYNKMESVLRGHRRALTNAEAQKASHAITPASNAAFTPVIPTTGADNGSGFKLITEADVFRLAALFDAIDAEEGDRHLVLHATMWNELVSTSDTLKKQREYSSREGVIGRNMFELAGFNIMKYRSGAIFNKSTGVKKAYGAAAAPATDTISSFVFLGSEVMKAVGTTDMFDRLKDPEARGDIVGFQQRFIALPIRSKFIGAIYSAAV